MTSKHVTDDYAQTLRLIGLQHYIPLFEQNSWTNSREWYYIADSQLLRIGMNNFERTVFRMNSEKLVIVNQKKKKKNRRPNRSPVHLNSSLKSSVTRPRGTYGDYMREAKRERALSRTRNRTPKAGRRQRASSLNLGRTENKEEDTEEETARQTWTEGSKLKVFHKPDNKWYRASCKRVIFDELGEWLEVEFLNDHGIMRRRQIPRSSGALRPIRDYSLPDLPAAAFREAEEELLIAHTNQKLDTESKDKQASSKPPSLQIALPEPIPIEQPDQLRNQTNQDVLAEDTMLSPDTYKHLVRTHSMPVFSPKPKLPARKPGRSLADRRVSQGNLSSRDILVCKAMKEKESESISSVESLHHSESTDNSHSLTPTPSGSPERPAPDPKARPSFSSILTLDLFGEGGTDDSKNEDVPRASPKITSTPQAVAKPEVAHTRTSSFEENLRRLEENIDPHVKSLLKNSITMDDHVQQLLKRSGSMTFDDPENPMEIPTESEAPITNPFEGFSLVEFLDDDGDDRFKELSEETDVNDMPNIPGLVHSSDMGDPLQGQLVDIDSVTPESPSPTFTSILDEMFVSSTKREEYKSEQEEDDPGEHKSSYGILWDTFAADTPPASPPDNKFSPIFPQEIVNVVKLEISMGSPDANIPDPIVENIKEEFHEEMKYLKERNAELERTVDDLTLENQEMQDILSKHIVILERAGTSPEEIINLKEQIQKLEEKLNQYEKEHERLQSLEETNTHLTIENRTLKSRITHELISSKQGESTDGDDTFGESIDMSESGNFAGNYTRTTTLDSVASDDSFALANISRTDEDGKEIPLGPELLQEICKRHDPINAGSLTENQFLAAFGEMAEYSKGLSIHSALHLFHELNEDGRVKYDDLHLLISHS